MFDKCFLGEIEHIDSQKPIKNLDIVKSVHQKLFLIDPQYRTNMWENSEVIPDSLRSRFLNELDGHDGRVFPTLQFWSDVDMGFKIWSATIQDYIIYDIDLLSGTYLLTLNKSDDPNLVRYKGEVMTQEMFKHISACETEMNKKYDSDSDISSYNEFILSDTDDDWSDQFDSDEE